MRRTDYDPRDLGLTILLLCELQNMSLRELGRRSGVDKGSINAYVKGTVRPTPRNLARLTEAFRITPLRLERLISRSRAFRLSYVADQQGEGAAVQAPAEAPRELEGKISSAALDAMAPFLEELGQLDRGPAPHAEDRLWAESRWSLLKPLTAADQSVAVDVLLGDERSWALAERICLASETAAANRADEALRLARLAVRIAEHVPDQDFRPCLLGWVEPFAANALRVKGDLALSAETLAHADGLWEQGAAGTPPGFLDESRRLDLKASLLMYYGKFQEVQTLLAAAMKDARTEQARARLLIKQARNVEFAGQYETALNVLAEAKPLIDAKKDPRLLLVHDFNKTVNLLHLDRFREAERLLPKVEALTDPGNELDGVRLRWLQGRTWAGLGRRTEAVAALAAVREYFLTEEIAYDFAVVSVELGTLYLEQGRPGPVRELADQMQWIFARQGIHQEALAALALFCHAAQAEEAQAQWTRRLVKYLYRAEHDPRLRFEAGT